jgi:hypothetical protein
MQAYAVRTAVRRVALSVSVVAAVVALLGSACLAQLPAFPGAGGEGMYVTGGRSGDVYHVTNLNDSGSGSLRYGLTSATKARTIVFDVSGVINLSGYLSVSRPNITIAGQTAPDAGIVIRNYGAGIGASNVIMQHLRIRPGDAQKGPGKFTEDSLNIGASHVMVDHCSTSWGIDENLSCNAGSAHDISVQYCVIAEGLDQTGLFHGAWDSAYNPGGTGHHSMGSLIKPGSGNGVVSYHHNLWANNYNRCPAVGTYGSSQTLKVDIRNNVIYNNRQNGYSSGDSLWVQMNYVGNYVLSGPETSYGQAFTAYQANHMTIYQSGNRIDTNRNNVLDGVDSGFSMISGVYTRSESPIAMRPVATQTADEAYDGVLSSAGAFFWNRDSVDERIVNDVVSDTGKIIDSQEEVGGYPVLPVVNRPADWDTDMDGMPNFWELANGMNPSLADNNGDLDGDGYTNLEEYLHYAAIPEPGTISLLLLGAGIGPWTRRLRRRASEG